MVLATLATGCLGWVGWEQHRQTQESERQTCIAHASAINAIDTLNAAGLSGRTIHDALIAAEEENLKAC